MEEEGRLVAWVAFKTPCATTTSENTGITSTGVTFGLVPAGENILAGCGNGTLERA